MAETEIEWPWQYNFPPFFTLQPNPDTRAKQVQAWKTLILDYCKRSKLYLIDVRETANIPLFNNSNINRKLDQEVVGSILAELQKTGHAAPIDKVSECIVSVKVLEYLNFRQNTVGKYTGTPSKNGPRLSTVIYPIGGCRALC